MIKLFHAKEINSKAVHLLIAYLYYPISPYPLPLVGGFLAVTLAFFFFFLYVSTCCVWSLTAALKGEGCHL